MRTEPIVIVAVISEAQLDVVVTTRQLMVFLGALSGVPTLRYLISLV